MSNQDIINQNGDSLAIQTINFNAYYGTYRAVNSINLSLKRNIVTAFIGPSGCGKSTLLRCFNRMNDLIPGFRAEGQVLFENMNLYETKVDSTEIRYKIGMVFQKPNPFLKSIYENVAFGLKINGYKGDLEEAVEQSLRKAALWDEVKDRLKKSALELSGGQQQRLCIARALAIEPEIILMDEPASALDPIATIAIEELIREIVNDVTIVIVTHNMQQAARVSDETAFLMTGEDRAGYLVEFGETKKIFTDPDNEKTEEYITGRFS